MPMIDLILEGDNCWSDLGDKEIIDLMEDAPPIKIAALQGGMRSGKVSLTIRLDLPDGRVVLTQTSLRLFLVTARALEARFGPQED